MAQTEYCIYVRMKNKQSVQHFFQESSLKEDVERESSSQGSGGGGGGGGLFSVTYCGLQQQSSSETHASPASIIFATTRSLTLPHLTATHC